MIEFKSIYLSFDEKKVFENFNMQVKKGEKVLLSAPSGSGKSSLFKLLLGFLRPKEGEIFFSGKRLQKSNLPFFRSHIGYVSQDVDFRNTVVWDLLVEIFSYKQNRQVEMNRGKVLALMEYFGLSKSLMEKEVNQLSGGERQRLGLIICILLDRPVWLLDEVTSGLDTDMKEKVVEYVLKQDRTVLIISHDKIWRKNHHVRIEEW
ncbi:ABC transporter ATP-binding protein [Crassaminicella profunda]|uniref:ABC transporter ATP-binding protein n=1 Tax=Crassaminicella profunda TaxID=1286698 RepID=UPI001CA6D0BB|nr:ABC transporter ATP-binding protein [Crassaminicella profunda]QZY55978.1 energy-coupling factor ABC transporter ATP-binding protein [Crassaminicella profunda]